MKKLFALALVVLGLAACQTEPEGLDVQMGGEQEVMLTVSLPETTRANSANGFDLSSLATTDYSLRYIVEVYRVNEGTVLYDNCQRFVETSKNTSMVFPVRLAPGYDYRIVAWTDIVEGDSKEDRYYYTEEGLDNVVIKDNGTVKWNAMDETRDAYTYVKVVDNFSSASNLDMTLTRPFAKLRVVATDIDDISKVGLVPTTATVEYRQDMYFKYNAVADIENKGAANDARAKSHTFTYTTTATQYVDNNGEYTLFTDYIFVPSTGTAKFQFNVYADAEGTNLIKATSFNTDIFVERNKLTTIKGDVLTVGGNVEVKVENDLGIKEEISYVDTIESLQDKINNAPDGTSTKIVLGGNVAIEAITRVESQYGLVIPAGKVIVLDLNCYTISQTKAQSGKYAMIENNGTLTICNSANTNGVISYGDTAILTADVGYASNTIQNNGTLTINEGVTLLNTSGTGVATYGYPHVIDTNGKLTINGGVLTNEANYSTMRIWTSNTDSEKCVVTINGGTFNGCIDFQAHNNNYPTIPHYGTLTVNGGTFTPDTFTNSAIRVLRFAVNAEDMHATINDGNFNGKILVRNFGTFTETPKIFDIYGGTFSTAAKEGTDVNLLANGYEFGEGENGNWTVESKGYYTDAKGNYHITGVKGWLWMADQSDTFFGSKTVYLDNDIDFTGVDMRVTRMFTSEYSATFDGQGHTVSNIWMASNYASNNQALFDGLMSVKNLNVNNAQVFGQTAVGIIGANIYGTIDNCHVKNSRAYGYVWQVGGIVGLHSWGEIKNCSVEDTSIECYYYGAVGAIAGCMNEISRNITNCSIKNCRLIKEGTATEYADYDGLFGAFAGYILVPGDITFTGSIENTTTKVNGITTDAAIYGEALDNSNVVVDGVDVY